MRLDDVARGDVFHNAFKTFRLSTFIAQHARTHAHSDDRAVFALPAQLHAFHIVFIHIAIEEPVALAGVAVKIGV